MTILLIEDDKTLADYLTLSLYGHEILVAANLATALKVLSVYKVNLMLIDLNLPDSRGLETLVALKTYVYPKVVISACCQATVAKMSGVMDYVDKADGPQELVARIRFNIGKLEHKTERFAPSVFEEIKAALIADRRLVAV